jgi:AcrR family transcriptional regulator
MSLDEQLSRRERKKMETRQRLMEAALALFGSRGYDATTIEEITETADVAKGTFFNYFDAKEAILPALAAWQLDRLYEALSPRQNAPESPVARIKMTMSLMADHPLTEPGLARRTFSALMHQRDGTTTPGRALNELLIEFVRQAQASGEIRDDVDPVHLGGLFRALFFQQVMLWHHGYRPKPLEQSLNQMVDLVLDGIGGTKWRDGR